VCEALGTSMSETSQGPGWWAAADGKWYAPELHPDAPLSSVVERTVPDPVDPTAKKHTRNVTFTHSEYLGGVPGTKKATGNLIFDDSAVGVGVMHPKKGLVAWSDMAGISFDSATMKKSRAGKAVKFGVFALAARKTQNGAEITVQLNDGNVALFSVAGKTGVQVRAKVQPLLIEHGVPCLDDAPLVAEVAAAPVSAADEIAKLVALRDSGAISDEEFAAYKANLLP
jgi:hypothetical protein